jgi:hypothetical protein
MCATSAMCLQSARSHTCGTVTTNVTWSFIFPSEHYRRRNHCHIGQFFHQTRNSPFSQTSLLIWAELIHVRMSIPILFGWQIPGILHDRFRLALRLLAKSDASSLLIPIFMTERTGFSLIRLHRMNLRFDVRIGKILLHFKRMFVYIALQGRCGPR